MNRGHPKWNPHDDPTAVVFVRVRAADKERFERLAEREEKRITDWCRNALLLVAQSAEDTESYLDGLREQQRPEDQDDLLRQETDHGSEEEVEIAHQIENGKLREHGGSEEG